MQSNNSLSRSEVIHAGRTNSAKGFYVESALNMKHHINAKHNCTYSQQKSFYDYTESLNIN